MSKVRIRAIAPLPNEISLFSFSKEILSHGVLEKAIEALGPAGLSQPDLQNEISRLQKKVKVTQEPIPEFFAIRCRDRDFAKAVRAVNAIATAFERFDSERSQQRASSIVTALDREIARAEEEIARLEPLLRKLEKESEPTEVDLQLAQKYKAAEARYRQLAETFTDQYPEIIDLKAEMASLKAQILDASFHDPELVERMRAELSSMESSYESLRLERENAKLKAFEVEDRVQIIALSPASIPPQTHKVPLIVSLVGGFVLSLLTLKISTRR